MKSKVIIILLSFIILISGVGVNVNATENSKETTVLADEFNIMLIIDKSGSMNNSDAGHVAQDAACMFVDSFQVSNSSIGLVTFSNESTVISNPIDMSHKTNKKKLKKSIEAIEYDKLGTGGTDLGDAVYTAASVLKDTADKDKKNLIIMFTDGYTEGLSSEALEVSNKKLESGIETAQQLDCEVYIVGLNSGGGIEEKGVNQIAYIASQTQKNEGINNPSPYDEASTGKVNYLITDSTNGIYTFYTQIFALLNGAVAYIVEPETEKLDGEVYTSFPVEISGSLIKEVDVYLTSDEDINIDTLVIRDANSKYIENEDVSISNGRRYAFIKIFNPIEGTWKISIRGKVKSRLTYAALKGKFFSACRFR